MSVLPRIKQATVLIGLPPEQLDDHAPGCGTGFFAIEPGLIVTNRHVVESHIEAKTTQWLRIWLPAIPKPLPYRVSGYLADPINDLCLLWVEDDGRLPAPLPLALDYQISEGEDVALCGYPYGFTNLFNRGRPGLRGVNSVAQRSIISALWPYTSSRGSEITLIQLDGLTNPGNSGSPVFLPATGEVIAVLTGFLQNRTAGQSLNTGISEAIPIHYIEDLMQKLEEKRFEGR